MTPALLRWRWSPACAVTPGGSTCSTVDHAAGVGGAVQAVRVFTAILTFAGLAMVLVLTGRVLARTGFVRLISPERVLLIGTGRASGALIEKMRAKASGCWVCCATARPCR
jgi:hypothetical protein